MADAIQRLSGNELLLTNNSIVGEATVLDFWQWAYSDLRANNTRGILAEWLVAKLLGLPMPCRDSWAGWDLQTTEGIKIEVKTSAYLQSWAQARESKIIFSGLKGRMQISSSQLADTATYNANIYVFCVQTERDHQKWNALDLNQWRFYVLTRDELAKLNTASLSLSTLEKFAKCLQAIELAEQIKPLVIAMSGVDALSS